MGHYRKKHGKIEVVWLDRPFVYVTDWRKGWNGRDIPVLATAQKGDALIIEGEGEDQDIYHLPREEALEQFEPEDEVVHEHRGAARRPAYEVDDPRRDGYREPRQDDHPRSMWRDSGPVTSTRMPVPVHPADSWPVEPYAMPTRKPLTVFGLGEEASEKSSA